MATPRQFDEPVRTNAELGRKYRDVKDARRMNVTHTDCPNDNTLDDAASLGTRRSHLNYSHISRATATPIGTK